MRTQAEKAKAFKALHERDAAFIIPNPYDAGTARLLAQLGFEALATTSAGCAFALGQQERNVRQPVTCRRHEDNPGGEVFAAFCPSVLIFAPKTACRNDSGL